MSRPSRRAGGSDWFDAIPKVEIHVHLEGAIPLSALVELIRKYGAGAVRSLGDLEARFRYRDFPHFIETWIWKNGFLRELDDFAFIAEAVARDLTDQRVLYAEAFCSPPDFAARGLPVGGIVEAIRSGLDRVPGIVVNLVVDLVRDGGPERAGTHSRRDRRGEGLGCPRDRPRRQRAGVPSGAVRRGVRARPEPRLPDQRARGRGGGPRQRPGRARRAARRPGRPRHAGGRGAGARRGAGGAADSPGDVPDLERPHRASSPIWRRTRSARSSSAGSS